LTGRASGTYLRFISPIRVKSIRSDGLLNFSLDSDKTETRKLSVTSIWHRFRYYKEQMVEHGLRQPDHRRCCCCLCFRKPVIRRALAPLTELQIPLARLARGEIDVNVERAKDEEIAVIGDALNTTIRALKDRDETLRKMAESDPLTGLVNRSYFLRELEKKSSMCRTMP
jgi:hypothetical protein